MSGKKPLQLHQRKKWLDADMETPISLYMKKVGAGNGVLLESAEVDGRWGRYSILAYDMRFLITCQNGLLNLTIIDPKFEQLLVHNDKPFIDGLRNLLQDIEIKTSTDNADELPPITRALYGFLGFGMAAIFNPHLQKSMSIADAMATLAFPGKLLVFDHLYNRLCQLSIDDDEIMPNEIIQSQEEPYIDYKAMSACPNEAGYKKVVLDIREKLRQGDAIQVVPSVRFCAPFSGNPFQLYRKLRRFNASPYMFYMNFPDITLFGSSPEVMVSSSNSELTLSPIAGTRRRGKNTAEDKKLELELLQDPKERAEHVMLVDLGRNDLGRIARPGSVKVKEYMQVQKFSHVMHLTSEIGADLRLKDASGRKMDALDVLVATFPAGTVSGAPKFRAMEIIRELEQRDRGPYAGCIGWIGLDKNNVNLDMGITIRSMWAKNGQICWQAGGGIVHDSDPELEWKEVCNKSAIMRLALNLEDKDNVPADR